MRVDNKVEPISTIDTKSKSNYLDEFEEFASNPVAVSICTRILKYQVWIIEFDELDFLSISNSNFATQAVKT